MTAMDVAHLPPALVRSGRVELWLEMKLPDSQARTQILSILLANLPEELRGADTLRIVAATERFTGADLKAMVEDGKAIFAYDRATNVEIQPTTEYFLRAVTTVQENKQHYATAEAQALMQPKSPMAGFMRSFVTSRTFKASEDDD
jgi:transitional endoplasmic reticulum ATPase